MNIIVEAVGFVACLFSILPYIPQIIKIYNTKATQGVSLMTYVFFCIGTILWGIYGILIHAMPIIISNSISFFLSLTIIIMKLKKN